MSVETRGHCRGAPPKRRIMCIPSNKPGRRRQITQVDTARTVWKFQPDWPISHWLGYPKYMHTGDGEMSIENIQLVLLKIIDYSWYSSIASKISLVFPWRSTTTMSTTYCCGEFHTMHKAIVHRNVRNYRWQLNACLNRPFFSV